MMDGRTKSWCVAVAVAGMMGAAMPGVQASSPGAEQQNAFSLPPVRGYLHQGEMPDSLLILNSPPPPGSAAEARDREASAAALARHGTARWDQAVADARLDFPAAVRAFDCTLGIEISATATPKIYEMMQRTLLDFGMSTSPTKKKFQRQRPFMVNGEPLCTPGSETLLRNDGSYPSGHSAVGFGWAMMMSAIAPGKSEALMRRGIAFGESRQVCNVHWLSDVEGGRVMAAAVYARLSALPKFRKHLAEAGKEYQKAVITKRLPSRACQ